MEGCVNAERAKDGETAPKLRSLPTARTASYMPFRCLLQIEVSSSKADTIGERTKPYTEAYFAHLKEHIFESDYISEISQMSELQAV